MRRGVREDIAIGYPAPQKARLISWEDFLTKKGKKSLAFRDLPFAVEFWGRDTKE